MTLGSVGTVITSFAARGATIWLDGNQLRFRAPAGLLTDSDLSLLRSRQTEIALYLKAAESAKLPKFARSEGDLVPSLTQEMWWRWISPNSSLVLTIAEIFYNISAQQLEKAIQGLVARHEVLRYRFYEEGRLRVLLNEEPFTPEMETIRSDLGPSGVAQRINDFKASPLTASSKWLVRAKVISLPHSMHLVILVLNHIVGDGTSVNILRSQLKELAVRPRLAAESSTHARYQDFSRWQRDWFSGSWPKLSDYWSAWENTSNTALVPSAQGAALRWGPGNKTNYEFIIPGSIHRRVANRARSLNTTLFLIYLAALAFSVVRWTGQRSFAVRCIVDGRTVPGLSNVVGLMTAADTIDICIGPDENLADTVKRLATEYYAAAKVRPLAIYSYPPSYNPGQSAVDRTVNAPIVYNYWRAARAPILDSPQSWPPSVTVEGPDHRSHDLPPVYFEVADHGNHANGRFVIRHDGLDGRDCDNLLNSFFEVLKLVVTGVASFDGL